MRFVSLLLLVLLSLSLVSCKPESARAKDEFRYIDRGDIITLDLNQMSYMQDFRIAFATREGLYTFDPQTFKPVPALAVSETLSPDKKTWTFKLRPEAKWDNGDPVTAGDFVFSWRLLLEAPGQYTSLLHYIAGAQAYQNAFSKPGAPSFDTVGVKAMDDLTLEVKLENPVPFFRDLMGFPIFYPRHAKSMEPFKIMSGQNVSYKPDYTRPPAVVTNGPFKLVKWEPGKLLRMEQNPHYWDRASLKLKAVESVVSNDAQSSFIQYDQGEVDWLADASQEVVYPLKQKGRTDVRSSPAFGTAFLTVNCAESVPELKGVKNPLADLRVRQAISLAVERKTLTESVTRMGEMPASHYMPPGFFQGYAAKPTDAENIEQAKKLLAEAGYPEGKGFPTLTIVFNSNNTIRRDLAASIENQLRNKLGIAVQGRGIELKSYRDELTHKRYTLGLAAWYGDYMDPSTFTDKYVSDSENNDSNWGPAAYDALIAKARQEPDEQKRYQLLADAETMINQDLPIIPLYHYVNLSLNRDNIKGLFTNAKNLTVFKPISIE